jgi:hypothetical protein
VIGRSERAGSSEEAPMIDESAKVFDLASYRKAAAAGPRGTDGQAEAAPALNLGATTVTPFAIPMAFLAAWPAFVFSPWTKSIRTEIGEGGNERGAEQTG